MAFYPNEKQEKDNMQKERRGFLKKTVYAAPTLIVLGGLIKPRNANALPNPPSDPDTNAWRRP